MSAGKERFARVMQQPDEELDLGLAALLIAQEEYPDLDVDRWLAELAELGRQARARVQPGMPPGDVVQALGGLLGGELGFVGNEDDYYDPRNSFLNDVLERRTGIPISLAAVYIEVGRRAGADVRGVGFPAHFLARCGDVIFDPFHGGRIVTEDDCRELLLKIAGSTDLQRRWLEPVPASYIVVRMLNNLKQIYLQSRYYHKAIGIMDRLLIVNPSAYEELRDRGAVHAELRQYGPAQADFQAYLKQPRKPEDALAVRQALSRIDSVLTLMDD